MPEIVIIEEDKHQRLDKLLIARYSYITRQCQVFLLLIMSVSHSGRFLAKAMDSNKWLTNVYG